jgi:hypothetical protein
LWVSAPPWRLCADAELESPGRALVITRPVIFASIRLGFAAYRSRKDGRVRPLALRFDDARSNGLDPTAKHTTPISE